MATRPSPPVRGALRRLEVLREANFRIFFAGYTTSMLGTSMATVALSFAVLEATGSLSDLSFVMAARIVPMVVFLLGGGILGDRLPRRMIMLCSDWLRALTQGSLAVLLMTGSAQLWQLLLLAALGGVGEAFFKPSFDGLVPHVVSAPRLPDANTMLGLGNSVASVAGPALAGLLVTLVSPATVLLVDAGTYALCALFLMRLRVPESRAASTPGLLTELRAGWGLFTGHRWLWIVTLQFTMFNFVVWAPYLVLGPAAADATYTGASSWGTIVSVYGAGSILGALFLLGRRPNRPLLITTLVTVLWAAPSAALAAQAPLVVVCAGALSAGVANSVFNALWMTTIQQHVPQDALSRVMSYVSFGAYSIGPLGLALAGPVAEHTSISAVLAVGVCWQLAANAFILCLPSVRGVRLTHRAAGSATEPAGERETAATGDEDDPGATETEPAGTPRPS
ncbi:MULTISPECIES: MFS transporter [Streptomyces]|uniref:MFS transporter n=1 Tax=Streptomyces TaxID=1883 RepID=UPI00099B7837|nr:MULTISPECIES: MFS transporter [Streptomyces]QHF95058.1 MFS transporter [Streptomyces sp. NHF165]